MKNLSKALCILLSVSILLMGCNKDTDKKVTKPVDTPKKEAETTPAYTFPLSGLAATEQSEQRPVAVMVNNHEKARPQSGISKADIIYEVLAEGDITRLLAIFQSEIPSVIGPIRSARDYYIILANGYKALYICHGNSPEAKQMLAKGVIDSLNGLYYDGTLFFRDKTRYAPHNSYITKDGIFKGAKQKNYAMSEIIKPLPFLNAEDVAASATGEFASGEKVLIHYSGNTAYQVSYQYDSAKSGYSRYQGTKQTVDRETNEAVLAKNVFIVKTPHKVIDSKGRRSIDLTSGGEGILLQNGKARDVKWINDNGRILPVDQNGTTIPFIPGQTWINIVPTTNNMVDVK